MGFFTIYQTPSMDYSMCLDIESDLRCLNIIMRPCFRCINLFWTIVLHTRQKSDQYFNEIFKVAYYEIFMASKFHCEIDLPFRGWMKLVAQNVLSKTFYCVYMCFFMGNGNLMGYLHCSTTIFVSRLLFYFYQFVYSVSSRVSLRMSFFSAFYILGCDFFFVFGAYSLPAENRNTLFVLDIIFFVQSI